MADIKTRLKLRYDSLENWASKNPALLDGEVAIAYLPPKGTGAAPEPTASIEAPASAVLMKTGPGAFNSLPFISALAADVYTWAKADKLYIGNDGAGNAVTEVVWDAENNGLKIVKGETFATQKALEDAIASFGGDISKIVDEDTRYSFDIATSEGHEGQFAVTSALYKNGVKEASTETTKYYDFVTPSELDGILDNYKTSSELMTILADYATVSSLDNYYTKTEVDNLIQGVEDIIDRLDESETTVAKGTAIDVTDAGTGNDHAYTVGLNVEGAKTALGLKSAAYETVEDLNATAKGYADDVETGVENGTIKAKDAEHADAAGKVDKALTVKVGGTDVVFDGSAEKTADIDTAISTAIGTRTTYTNTEIDNKVGAVLGTSSDAATANTVYGAKAAAAAAQSDATTAKTKIEAFLGAITPEGTSEAIDTLAEIQKYMTDDTQAFTQLSTKVTNIENGTTTTKASSVTTELENTIKGYTVANATNAANAAQLGGQAPSHYATATSVTDITKDNGTIDTKVKAAIDAEVLRADGAYKTKQEAKTYTRTGGSTIFAAISQDANGVISVEYQDVQPSDIGAADRDILDHLDMEEDLLPSETINVIKQTDGLVSVTKQNIQIAQGQVDGLGDALNSKLDANGWVNNSSKDGWSITKNNNTTTLDPTHIQFQEGNVYTNVSSTGIAIGDNTEDSNASLGADGFSVTDAISSGEYSGIGIRPAGLLKKSGNYSQDTHKTVLFTLPNVDSNDTLVAKSELGALATKSTISATDFKADEVFIFDCGGANGWS